MHLDGCYGVLASLSGWWHLVAIRPGSGVDCHCDTFHSGGPRAHEGQRQCSARVLLGRPSLCQDFAPGTEVVIEGRGTRRREAALAIVPHARIAEVSGLQRASRHGSAAGQDHRASGSQFARCRTAWQRRDKPPGAGGRAGFPPVSNVPGYNVQLSSSDGPLEQIAKIKGDNLRMWLGSLCVSHAKNSAAKRRQLEVGATASAFRPWGCTGCNDLYLCGELSGSRGVQRHGRGLGKSGNAATCCDSPRLRWNPSPSNLESLSVPRSRWRRLPQCMRGSRRDRNSPHLLQIALTSARAPDFVPMRQMGLTNIPPNPHWQEKPRNMLSKHVSHVSVVHADDE